MTEAASSNDDPLPVGQTLTPEELQGRFTLTEVRPAANPGHGFRLLVPKGWVADTIDGMDQPVNTMQLTPLAGWHAPKEGAPVVFHVQAVDLTRVITAAHFTVSYGLRQQLELMAMRELSSFLADARLRQRIEGQPFGVRMATRFEGDRAFIATGLAHALEDDEWQETFGVMIASLEVLEQPDYPYVERRIRRNLMNEVSFDAPVSFPALPASGGSEEHQAIDLFHTDTNEHFTGFVRIELERGAGETPVARELAYVVAHLQERGLELESNPTEIPVDTADSPIEVTKMVVFRATVAGNEVPQEAWVTLMRVRGHALRAWMIGPARQGSFDHWAVNQRAYRIMMETLELTS